MTDLGGGGASKAMQGRVGEVTASKGPQGLLAAPNPRFSEPKRVS